MKKNLLITGGSGFIGSYIIDSLIGQYNINVIGRQNTTSLKTSNNVVCPYYYCNYSKDSVVDLIRKVKPHGIVHLAAFRPVGNNTINDYYENLTVSGNLFESCLEFDIKNIINISTRLVYSHDNPLPWRENSQILPIGYYGLSKQWVEQTAAYYNQKGLKIKTLRLGQVIGLWEREGYALKVYLDNAIKGKPITVFGLCKGKRHYVYAKDVAASINAALENLDKKGIYNIGMENIYGFDELAQTINSVFGNKSEIIFNRDAKADESTYQMSIVKAKKELGWRPKYDLYQTYSDIKQDIEQLNY